MYIQIPNLSNDRSSEQIFTRSNLIFATIGTYVFVQGPNYFCTECHRYCFSVLGVKT